jgi:hypothetical protein
MAKTHTQPTDGTPPSLEQLQKWEKQDREDVIINTLEKLSEDALDYDRMNILAKAYSQKRHYAKAIPYLQRFEKQGKNDSLWNWRMGLCLYVTNKSAAAVPYLERAIELGDDYDETKEYLALAKAEAKLVAKKVTMTVDEVKQALKRHAIIFCTGGKRPTKELLESWIGRVAWKLPHEDVPVDDTGDTFYPIATLFLKDLPFCPAALAGIELITIFMSKMVWELDSEDLSPRFCIRCYQTLEGLIPCEYTSDLMKPFPLTPQLVENVFPSWDEGGMPSHLQAEILKMEEMDMAEYYDDICEETFSQHKIGGYPAFCQPGHWFGADYPFVMQISSDEKAGFNIVDAGNFYFYYNADKGNWKVYCDFY